MHGHQPLIELRRRGLTTPAVFVSDGPVHLDLDRLWPDPVRGSEFAHVRIDATDTPETLDLRFAVGLQVHVEGWRSEDRAKRLHEAFVAAGARAVTTTHESQLWITNGRNSHP